MSPAGGPPPPDRDRSSGTTSAPARAQPEPGCPIAGRPRGGSIKRGDVMTVMHANSRTAFPNSRGYPRSPSPVYPEPDTQGLEGAERLAGFLGWVSIGL